MICSIIKQLPFDVLQNAVREKPAKLEELTLLKVRLWLVFVYFRNRIFGNFGTGRGNFPVSGREFPLALIETMFLHRLCYFPLSLSIATQSRIWTNQRGFQSSRVVAPRHYIRLSLFTFYASKRMLM